MFAGPGQDFAGGIFWISHVLSSGVIMLILAQLPFTVLISWLICDSLNFFLFQNKHNFYSDFTFSNLCVQLGLLYLLICLITFLTWSSSWGLLASKSRKIHISNITIPWILELIDWISPIDLHGYVLIFKVFSYSTVFLFFSDKEPNNQRTKEDREFSQYPQNNAQLVTF